MNPIWYSIMIIVLITITIYITIGLLSQKKISKKIDQYRIFKTSSETTTEELSLVLISKSNISVEVVKIDSKDTNCYKSKYKVLKLSNEMANSKSIVSLSKISQEIGNAIQDCNNNFFYKIQKFLLPVINLFLMSFFPLFIIGLAFAFSFNLELIGLIISIISVSFLLIGLIFYIFTIPIINKSSELVAIKIDECKFLLNEEVFIIKDLLYTNSSIYLYSMITNLFYFIYLFTTQK